MNENPNRIELGPHVGPDHRSNHGKWVANDAGKSNQAPRPAAPRMPKDSDEPVAKGSKNASAGEYARAGKPAGSRGHRMRLDKKLPNVYGGKR